MTKNLIVIQSIILINYTFQTLWTYSSVYFRPNQWFGIIETVLGKITLTKDRIHDCIMNISCICILGISSSYAYPFNITSKLRNHFGWNARLHMYSYEYQILVAWYAPSITSVTVSSRALNTSCVLTTTAEFGIASKYTTLGSVFLGGRENTI